jgi:ribosomal protein S14
MRSSVVIDNRRRHVVHNREEVVRDIKAVSVGLAGPSGSTVLGGAAKEQQTTNAPVRAGVLLGRLRPRGTQIRRRCVATGRGRGVLRRFRRSRIKVRERALRGELSCVRKRTW